MAVRLYLVPKVGSGVKGDPFRPKYIRPDELGPGWAVPNVSTVDYGDEAVYLLIAEVDAVQHTTLSAQVDVLAVPATLDERVSAVALATIRAKLEAMHLPGGWITTEQTYREVLRSVVKIMKFLTRWQGLFPGLKLFSGTIDLDTRWNQLPNAVQQRLRDVAASYSLDTSGITNTSTLRDLLRLVCGQLPAPQVGDEVL